MLNFLKKSPEEDIREIDSLLKSKGLVADKQDIAGALRETKAIGRAIAMLRKNGKVKMFKPAMSLPSPVQKQLTAGESKLLQSPLHSGGDADAEVGRLLVETGGGALLSRLVGKFSPSRPAPSAGSPPRGARAARAPNSDGRTPPSTAATSSPVPRSYRDVASGPNSGRKRSMAEQLSSDGAFRPGGVTAVLDGAQYGRFPRALPPSPGSNKKLRLLPHRGSPGPSPLRRVINVRSSSASQSETKELEVSHAKAATVAAQKMVEQMLSAGEELVQNIDAHLGGMVQTLLDASSALKDLEETVSRQEAAAAIDEDQLSKRENLWELRREAVLTRLNLPGDLEPPQKKAIKDRIADLCSSLHHVPMENRKGDAAEPISLQLVKFAFFSRNDLENIGEGKSRKDLEEALQSAEKGGHVEESKSSEALSEWKRRQSAFLTSVLNCEGRVSGCRACLRFSDRCIREERLVLKKGQEWFGEFQASVKRLQNKVEEDKKQLEAASRQSREAEERLNAMVKDYDNPAIAMLAMVELETNAVAQENKRRWMEARNLLGKADIAYTRSKTVYETFSKAHSLIEVLMANAKVRNERRKADRVSRQAAMLADCERHLEGAVAQVGQAFRAVCAFLVEERKYKQEQRRNFQKELNDYTKYMDGMVDQNRLNDLTHHLNQAQQALRLTDHRTEDTKKQIAHLWSKVTLSLSLFPLGTANKKKDHVAKVLYAAVGPYPHFLALLPDDCKGRAGHTANIKDLVKVKDEKVDLKQEIKDPSQEKKEEDKEETFFDADEEEAMIVEEAKVVPEAIEVVEEPRESDRDAESESEGEGTEQGCILC